jgi:hypothetical protein
MRVLNQYGFFITVGTLCFYIFFFFLWHHIHNAIIT